MSIRKKGKPAAARRDGTKKREQFALFAL